jgi:hypothetical protein
VLSAINSNYRVDFTQEDLSFTLSKVLFTLDGDYMFSNYSPEDIVQNIYFPIPADEKTLPAQNITMNVIKPLPGQKVKIMSISPQGFWFELTLPAQTIAVCKIKYEQKLLGKSAKYILLTANSWGKPLEYAKYRLSVSKHVKMTKMPLDNPVVKKGLFHNKYGWEYNNYVPDKDFIVEFE